MRGAPSISPSGLPIISLATPIPIGQEIWGMVGYGTGLRQGVLLRFIFLEIL